MVLVGVEDLSDKRLLDTANNGKVAAALANSNTAMTASDSNTVGAKSREEARQLRSRGR